MKSESKKVVGVFSTRFSADACFDALLKEGFRATEIDVLMSDKTRSKVFPVENHEGQMNEDQISNVGGPSRLSRSEIKAQKQGTKAGSMATEGIGVGGAVGTAVGATIAAIAAVGTSLLIPGLNLIIAGPIVAALAGGGTGAVTGGLVGGLVGLGFTEQNAKVYNKALQEGGVIMSVMARDAAYSRVVMNTMIKNSGEQVACT